MQKDNSLSFLCNNLRRLRAAHGLTKKQMAEILGISIRSLTLLENNVIPPRLGCQMLFQASGYFGIKAHKLLQSME